MTVDHKYTRHIKEFYKLFNTCKDVGLIIYFYDH